jgi:peroxiredoxin
VAVSADHPADLEELRVRFRLSFPLVSDPDVLIAKAYGVRQKDRELALPSVFVVGPDGKIRFVRVGRSPVDRVPIRDVLAALRG